ncbi:2-amino-4-hydroxy-6-hydroxymethyldihydropteridine pyrophosphokinase [Legionella norrlandica]|uniref:2-amino-4-hydroxy-6-hydroxymethyldihydropteridine pyrophosphokinase n=1 Tax=Legionella norrlandica TaxID=1498499 RepID=A0A0A2SRP0_9GAMM|nr:2-amino-4-hydroxy-6-hydroxymethyldihydropteridine diphosphokinase [Legionella norrlandica]KGP63800.1 2-amino-4-hydroxy-6-hydroxymethyldihydropteridine pyrophosphokinase [Legionella norrlandica]
MNVCYLSLGSNQKCPERQIRQAIKEIKQIPSTFLTQTSHLYWNKAWGLKNQQDFCNVMVEIKTTLLPHTLLKWCEKIENKHKRIRKKHWGPRTLDVDIILYGSRSIRTKNLTIPHPRFHLRDFVLIPLSELKPNFQLSNCRSNEQAIGAVL